MAWFKYLKSTESINSSTTNSNYSYPYCKRFIGRFTPRDTINSGTWIFANILDININTYKDTSLENQIDETSYVVTYEKGEKSYPVETVIEGNYLYFKTHEIHTAAEEITGQYAVYYNTPNLRKINEVDNGGVEDYQVNLAPVWEDLELAPFIVGVPYLDGLSAIGTVYSISSGALPTGLSINSSTGQITGTVNSSGAYSFTARATTDDGKYYNEASFSGTIYEYLEWVDSTLANIDYNTAYSNSVWAEGYPAATYSISSGALPSGIILNSVTGLVSGITTASGAYSFTIKAENAIGSITQSFSGTVQSPPSWSDQTLGIITQGVSYSDGVSATGTATIVYSVHSGSLPTGLSLNTSSGAITGTTGSTGSYSFTIRATNTWGYVEKAFSGTIYQIPAWTDSTIANMIYGQAYSDAVAASGYPAVIYSISTGALPSGITLNSSTGAITGTSTTAGSYSFTVKAENAAGNVTQLFTDDLYVTPAWTDNTLVAFSYNTAYSDQVVATGSPTYTISSGTLPTGLSLNSSTGAVTGTPTYYGAYSFTIQAANETGSVTQSFSGAINRTPSWTDNTLATPIYNTAYSDSVVAIGYPTPTYSVTTGTLPTGLSLNSSSGAVTGTTTASGAHSFTITASNTEGSVSQAFTFTIVEPFSATGGTTTDSGGYRYHTFNASGNFVITGSPSKTIEVLIVGGGGAGTAVNGAMKAGGGYAGNAGGGGVDVTTSLTGTVGTYTVVVGGGGINSNGTSSSFNATSASGGTIGRAYKGSSSRAGSSGANLGGYNYWGGGGGGGRAGEGTGASSANNNGANGASGATWNAFKTYGGGGGGGAARMSFISGGAAGSVGVGQAGGGNGGTAASVLGGVGGVGSPATANSGSGGGGGGSSDDNSDTDGPAGGNGGSGVVIVRYLL